MDAAARPEDFSVLLATGLWLLWAGVWFVAQVLRLRVPAPLFWLGPVGVVVAGAWSSWAILIRNLTLDTSSPQVILESLQPLQNAWLVIAFGLVLSAVVIGLGNILRGGRRWTLRHGITPLLGAFTAPLFLLGSWETAVVVALGMVGLTLASMRIGKGSAGRRMAAGRVLVASTVVGALLALAIRHAAGDRIQELQIWFNTPHVQQDEALAALSQPMLATAFDLAAAVLVLLIGAVAVLPVRNKLVDGRSAAGFVCTLLMVASLAVVIVPVFSPLTTLQRPDPLRDRLAAIAAMGLVLPEHQADHAWQPGLHLQIGLYWVSVDEGRVLPFKEGIPDPEFGMEALDRALAGTRDPLLVIEADHRIDARRFMPVLHHARQAGIQSVCWVVQDGAALGCRMVRLDEATAAMSHLLVRAEETIYVGGGEPVELTLEALPGPLEAPVALHIQEDLTLERLLLTLDRNLPEPLIVVPL